MKRIYKVGNEYFEKKTEAKAYRNKLEGYTPVLDKKTGKFFIGFSLKTTLTVNVISLLDIIL